MTGDFRSRSLANTNANVKLLSLKQKSIKYQSVKSAQHLKRVNEFKYMCKHYKCGKTFVSDSGLKRHERQHQSRDFQCEVCGREFPFRSELATHQTIHSEKKKLSSTQSLMVLLAASALFLVNFFNDRIKFFPQFSEKFLSANVDIKMLFNDS